MVETLSTLGPHLGRWGSRDVNVDVSLQGRGGKEQRVTLRTSLPGLTPLIAVAENPDITHALGDAKRELIRQLDHQRSAYEPMNNRRSSATIRHPGTSTFDNHSSLRGQTIYDEHHRARVIGNYAVTGGPSQRLPASH